MTEEWNPQPFDEPPWLDAKIDQFLARLNELKAAQMAEAGGYEVIMMTLTEPASREDAKRWERTCDNCGAYVPEGAVFFTRQSVREFEGLTIKIVITWGMCSDCKP